MYYYDEWTVYNLLFAFGSNLTLLHEKMLLSQSNFRYHNTKDKNIFPYILLNIHATDRYNDWLRAGRTKYQSRVPVG
jgi:hypothetical protein